MKPGDFQVLQGIIEQGLRDASLGLSAMTTGSITLDRPNIACLPLSIVPNVAGGPAAVVVAVYLGITGDMSGHLMLLFSEESARQVVDILCGYPAGTVRELDPMAHSALAEAANICGSHFLNALSNHTGLTIIPTAPSVVTDMAGAILQTVVADLFLGGDEALVVETGFNGSVRGHFLLMPDQDSMARLVAALESMGA